MLGTSSDSYRGYYASRGYKFLPGDKVKIPSNGKTRLGRIEGGDILQGKRCYFGHYTDGNECFINIPEDSVSEEIVYQLG